jgi:hypothetical protein
MKNLTSSGIISGLLAISLGLASCASAPTQPPAPAAAQPAPAATGTTASTARPEFPGFALVIRKGEELYCQKRNPTGSRARVIEACYTRDQMLKMAANNDDFFKQAAANGSHDILRTDTP